MRKIKTFLSIFIVIISSVAIAKNYIVETENENISCELHIISPANLLKITNKQKPSVLNIFEKYLPVQVIIKNNSSKTITINKNDYLQGLENFLIPKELFNELIKEQIGAGSLYFAALWGWLSFYFGKKTLISVQDESIFWSLLTLIPTTFFGRWALENILHLLEIKREYETKEIEAFKNQAYTMDSGQDISYYSINQSKYEIRPKQNVNDLFFVDRKALPESFFDQTQIKLKYHKSFDDKSKWLRELDSQQQAILTLFKKRKIITAKDIQDFFSISPRSASGLCLKWLDNGFLIFNNPAKKSRKYELNPEISKKLFE